MTPVPKPRKRRRKKSEGQGRLGLGHGDGISSEEQEYNPTPIINEIRGYVDQWRALPQSQWLVTPETARLLRHWRHHEFQDLRPFFCQVEAVETAIWLAEVAPKLGRRTEKFWAHVKGANGEAKIAGHPAGFVVNTRRRLDPLYVVLHRATCPTVNAYRRMHERPGGFTGRSYQKICTETADELAAYLEPLVGRGEVFSKRCRRCL